MYFRGSLQPGFLFCISILIKYIYFYDLWDVLTYN